MQRRYGARRGGRCTGQQHAAHQPRAGSLARIDTMHCRTAYRYHRRQGKRKWPPASTERGELWHASFVPTIGATAVSR